MTARNLFGALALDTTLVAARDILGTIRDAVTGVLQTRPQTYTAGGTITASGTGAGAIVDAGTDLASYSSVRVQLSGTFVATIQWESSVDGVTWVTQALQPSTPGGSFGPGSTTSAAGIYAGLVRGRYFRARGTSFTSGTILVSMLFTGGVETGPVSLASGGNTIGVIGAGSATIGNVKPGFVTATGTISALNGTVDGTTDLNTYASVRVQITGTFVGTLAYETSVDGVNWQSQQLTSAPAGLQLYTTTIQIVATGDLAGRYFRIRSSSWTSGTATVTLLYSAASRTTPQQTVGVQGNVNTVGQPSANAIGRVGHDSTIVNATITSAASPNVDGVTDLSAFSTVHVQITGPYVGTLVPQFSNNGTDWTTAYWQNANASAGGLTNQITATSTTAQMSTPVRGRYFRLVNSAYVSGTAVVSILYTAASFAAPNGSVTLLNSSVGLNATTSTGTLAALNGVHEGAIDLTSYASVKVQVTGTFVGTLTPEASNDGTNWVPVLLQGANNATGTGVGSLGVGLYSGSLRARYFRVRFTAYTSGTATINILYNAAPDPSLTALAQGGNSIGNVNLNSGTNTLGGIWVTSGNGRAPVNFNIVSTASTNANLIVNGGRWLQEITATNPTTTPVYLKVFAMATAPVVGTDVPRFIIALPPNSTVVMEWGANGKAMQNGIALSITGNMGVADSAVAVAGILVDGTYV